MGLPLSLVLDGYIEHDNLKRFNLTEEKLLDKLSKYQIKDLKELFFVSIDKTGKISWQRKKEVN